MLWGRDKIRRKRYNIYRILHIKYVIFKKDNMKLEDIKYPQYYNVDDVPVTLELDGEEVIGKIANGKPYQVGKAITEGFKITKEEYITLGKELYGDTFVNPK